MKKSILCILVAAFAMIAGATPVTSSQAKQAARAWAQRNAAFVGKDIAMTGSSAVAVQNAEGVTLWYRVALNNGSCIVVSPVMELEPVIACLENVPADGLPVGHPMRAMLERDMADRLKKLGLYVPASTGPTLMSASPLSATPEDPVMAAWAEEGKAKWARLAGGTGGPQLMAAKEEGIVDIETKVAVVKGFDKGEALTHWNQSDAGGGHCYNYYTPNNAVCGCVATMMSAIMQYFAVTGGPTGVTGVLPATYNDSDKDADGNPFVTLGGTYDWGCLTNSDESVKTTRADYNSLSEAQRQFLGRVAYDAGVAIGMAWTDGESGAQTIRVAEAFRKVFGFKDARGVSNPTEEQYDKLIYHQCMAGAPVGLSIHTDGQSGGHAVVAVGYGEDEYGVPRTRIFTGWGGAGDGWYALPYITTASVPGGGSHVFDVIAGVITMIGYDSDETVPVVGHVDAPGEAIEVPGAATDTTIYASDLGYFGTRVAPNVADKTLHCRGKEAQFEIGAAAAVTDDEYIVDGEELCTALPEYIEFMLLNSSVAYTFAKAKEMALAEGKAILRISGVTGTEPTTNLLAYVYSLDEGNVGDFTNKFVYFFSSAKSSSLGDGNPSMGVFLPQEAEQSGHWRPENGRLSYGYGYFTELQQTVTNDYEVADEEKYYMVTNAAYVASWGSAATGTYASTNLSYEVEESASMIDALTTMAQFVLDGGWDEYCRRTHGIALTVTAMDEVGTPDPMFGIHENIYTNGQEITAIAPDGEVTNREQTVVSGFGAWMLTVTNTVAGGAETSRTGTGTEATFALASNDVATLTWLVVPKQVWIEITDVDDGGVTEPGSGWYAVGEQVTFVATPSDPESAGFSQWGSGKGFDWPGYMPDRTSPVLSFLVHDEPLSLFAYYEGEYSAEAGATTNFTVRVVSVDTNGAEFVDSNLPNVHVLVVAGKGPVDMGGEIELPDVSLAMRVQATVFTNSQDEVWQCVGWTLEPNGAESAQTIMDGTSDMAAFTPEGAAVLSWVWKPLPSRRPLVYPDDVPVAADGVSSPLTIYPNADGTLTVEANIGNPVKGWWYVLRTCDTLTGTYVPAQPEGAGDVCAALAEADGTLELRTTFTPTDAKRFYKVTVEEEEP